MDDYDIFISYRTTQSEWVETLAHNLKNQGYSIFLDHWELIAGQDFPLKIHKALQGSSRAILVATPDTSESGWVQQELQLMFNLKISKRGFFFIPVVMGQFPDLPFLENVQAVDFGDCSPEVYRKAFHRLLCGLKQTAPGPDTPFKGELRFPEFRGYSVRQPATSEFSFCDEAFNQLETGMPLIILAQAGTNSQVYSQILRKKAESLFGEDNVYHIFPPNSTRADSAAYFGRLARQCHFEKKVSESWQWEEMMAEKLDDGQPVFLLVTGFENGPDECRAEFAGELRQLNERYPSLRIAMMGGEQLARLKYAHGSHSLLNIAQELPIPKLDHRDIQEIFAGIYPQLDLSPEQLKALLEFTGCHPRLLHYCLQKGADSPAKAEKLLRSSPLPAQLFTRFHQMDDRIRLCGFLANIRLDRYDPWPADELLRRLYWNNLITCRGQDFCWRCEFIRQTGRELLECR